LALLHLGQRASPAAMRLSAALKLGKKMLTRLLQSPQLYS
jgi:hypothetical protein